MRPRVFLTLVTVLAILVERARLVFGLHLFLRARVCSATGGTAAC